LRQRRSEETQPVRAEYRFSNLGGYDLPHSMQVRHGIYLRWTLFKTEAAIEIRPYPHIAPTADTRNVVRVPSQVFVKRDGYRSVAIPARLEKTVVED